MRHFLFVLAMVPAVLSGQNLKTDWEKYLGGSGKVHALMEATNGYLLAVGETNSKTAGGADGWVLFIDHSTGQIASEFRFGGAKDDAFYAVAQTFDGRFLLAGSSASSGQGGDDAWLVSIDETGKKLWETTFGTPGRDVCEKMLLLSDGTALLAGYRNNRKDGDIWLAKADGNKLAWEKLAGDSEFDNLAAMVAAPDGGVVFAGNTGKKAEKGTGNIYLAKTDASGNLVWKKWFGESGWEEALDLVATRDGGYAIAGLTKSKGAGDLDCWLVKASRDGFKQWDKTFGGRDADLANTLVQTADDGFLLAGSSRSQRSGARFSDGYVVQTTPGGDLQWEQYFGKDPNDVFMRACMLHNGSTALLGTMDGDRLTLYHCSDPQTMPYALAGVRDASTLKVSETILRSADGTFTPGERGYLSFRLENTGDIDVNDLRVTVDQQQSGGLAAWETNYLGSLRKAKSMVVRIPLLAAAELAPGMQTLKVNIASGNKSLQTFDQPVELRVSKPATLLFTGHDFAVSGRSDEVTLNVTIQNSGDASSLPAEIRFNLPAGLKASSAMSLPLGIVGPHSSREASLTFVKTQQFNEQVAAITCAIRENGVEAARKTFEFQTGSGQASVASGPILIWTDPAPHETGTNKVRKSDNHFEFKMTVVSPKPVNTKNIKMKVNGVEMDGSKFNEEDLSAPRMENTRYTYTYRNKIPLQQGSNRVEVVVDDQVSDPIEVEFVPERANLFVVSIGPKHEDLQYTAKDALDFANAFKNQGGSDRLFNQVIVKTLTTPDETDDRGIKQVMYDLAYQWNDGQIKPNDMLIVFLSSHGKIVENRFKILQTGYNPKYERLAVDFKTDILETLSPVNCKKLIFLDACHSGGAKEGFGGLSQAVVELARTQPGVSTLTSCGSTEKSYEDKSWENGAFTEALLDAFNNTTCTDTEGQFSADANHDRILRLGELYDFLRRRVPAMVRTAVPNAPTSQTPFMPENELDKNLPLYILDQH